MPRKVRKRANGTGSCRQVGSRWTIQWTSAGKRHTKSFPGREDALVALAGIGVNPTVKEETDIPISSIASRWLQDRSHKRSYYQDSLRWDNHLLPLIGHLTPDSVTVSVLKDVLRALRGKGLSNTSIRLCIALLSAMYSDMVEDEHAKLNVTKLLGKKTRAEYLRPTYDTKTTPFLANPDDALRVYRWLKRYDLSVAAAYALGAFAGLRTGEARALEWSSVDFERKTITVSRSVEKRTGRPAEALSVDGFVAPKSGFSRVVPMSDKLEEILRDHKWVNADGLVAPGLNGGVLPEERIGHNLSMALCAQGLPLMTNYQAGRHSFASQWVMAGGNIHTLSRILGHSSSQITEKYYVHLVPGSYTDADRSRVKFSALDIPGAI